MKKTKTKVEKEIIEPRRQLHKKELSLKGEDVFSCSVFPDKLFPVHFTNSEVCEDPVKIVRLRTPEYETGKHFDISDGIPTLRTVMKDSGFLDADGYLHLRIKPDAPKDLIHYFIDKTLECYSNYPLPKEDPWKKERFRAEKITALEVWEHRRLQKSFPEIARTLKIKKDAARKMFYVAYEHLYGKKYDPAEYEKPEIKKKYLKRSCESCNENPDNDGTCTDLCPDVIEFVNQNTSYRRESLTK